MLQQVKTAKEVQNLRKPHCLLFFKIFIFLKNIDFFSVWSPHSYRKYPLQIFFPLWAHLAFCHEYDATYLERTYTYTKKLNLMWQCPILNSLLYLLAKSSTRQPFSKWSFINFYVYHHILSHYQNSLVLRNQNSDGRSSLKIFLKICLENNINL